MKKRQSSFELLRIIAMCMIITMHYMNKGMELPKLSVEYTLGNSIYHLIYSFCLGAVNVYVLISGYFLCDSRWEPKKLIKLWIQILSYSILIALVASACGYIEITHMNLGILQQVFLPIEYEHYWFATAYMMMYILVPVLVSAVNNLSQNQLKVVILVILVVFSGLKSVNPYLIPWDRYGCDALWFMCLFLVAGYIKRYRTCLLSSMRASVVVYVAGSAMTFIIANVYAVLVRHTGRFEFSMDMVYSYNYVTVLLASVGLFGIFYNLSIKEDGEDNSHLIRLINKIGSCTFGVYLLHEHILIRFHWFRWIGIESVQGKWYQCLHLIVSVLLVMIIGTVVELIRSELVKIITKNVRISNAS